MEYRRLGRTSLELSVVGLGTAQLQMLPERVAVETLARGFELGVNWVHTAPDYGNVERWIQRGIERSGRHVMVAGTGPGEVNLFEAFFENTCTWFKRDHVELYGINCIDDVERMGGNVWGAGGMVERLKRWRAEGRLDAAFCTTHGPPSYVANLVRSGVFDAVMLACNPLGFHLLTYDWSRDGRGAEDMTELRRVVFPLAAAQGVSLLVMKVLGGGLLSRGRAFPPHAWFPSERADIPPTDLMRYMLGEPGVTAVVPGVGSPEEAEEDALAGYAPTALPPQRRAAIEAAAAEARLSLCSRCAQCEPTCSRGLPISSMFRDAYIWTYRSEAFMADERENYFRIHPAATLACADCTEVTCECPQGLSVPIELARADQVVRQLALQGVHPGPPATLLGATEGRFAARVLSREVPDRARTGEPVLARFVIESLDRDMWTALGHSGDRTVSVALGIAVGSTLAARVPIRQNVSPGERAAFAVEFEAPDNPGRHELAFHFMPLDGPLNGEPPFARGTLLVEAVPEYGVQVVEHTIPSISPAGRTWGMRVTLANRGSRRWQGGGVDLVEAGVFVDGRVVAAVPLPIASVAPGEEVSLHFALRMPEVPGEHTIRVALARRGVAWFHDHGVSPLDVHVIVSAPDPETETDRALAASLRRNLWHYQPTAGIARSRDGRPFPLFVARAKGSRVWDPEGHEFLDYTMGWGSTILGYADDRIQAAVASALETGSVVPLPYPLEMTVADMIAEDFPSVEMLAFGKNGSDACTVAARLARLATGRRVILSCGFHGWQDAALGHLGEAVTGIPERGDTSFVKFGFNDRNGFLDLYFRHKNDLAAVMIEPSGPVGDHGPSPDADPVFLEILAQSAKDAGALLIFDEIITGYRYPEHSVQRATGITPDLTCLGKALASGLPLAAVGGRAALFHDHFFKTRYNPTFKAELYALAAAHAAIEIYRREPVAERLWAHGRAIGAALDALCRERGLDARVSGPPFRFALTFGGVDRYQVRLKKTLFVQELLKRGVITVSGVIVPSAAHTDADGVRMLAAAAEALDVVADASRRRACDRAIEIPLL